MRFSAITLLAIMFLLSEAGGSKKEHSIAVHDLKQMRMDMLH